eukprot:1156297-Pelagomonas_calceolata.AAC.3
MIHLLLNSHSQLPFYTAPRLLDHHGWDASMLCHHIVSAVVLTFHVLHPFTVHAKLEYLMLLFVP